VAAGEEARATLGCGLRRERDGLDGSVGGHTKDLDPPARIASHDLVALPEREAKAKFRPGGMRSRSVASEE